MIQAFISRYGDRIRARGCALNKTGVNRYSLHVPVKSGPHAFVEPEQYRAATVHRAGLTGHEPYPYVFEIYTFNMLNGYHPDSDLIVRVCYEGDPEVVSLVSAKGRTVVDAGEQDKVLVQAYAQDFRWTQVERSEKKVEVTPLITRVPPTPVETDIEVVVIRPFGPLRY